MDTITKQCEICGHDFDFLPNAELPTVCDGCSRPRLLKMSMDGNMFCILEGDDLQSGTAGFGKTPEEAFSKYLKSSI